MLWCIRLFDSVTQGYSVLSNFVCLFYQFLRELLKFLNIIVDLSVSPYSSSFLLHVF